MWSIESDLHIAEEEVGSNENWQKLSDNLKIIHNPFYELCISSSSKKVENSVSFESYLNQTQNDINTIDANDLIKDFFVFNNFFNNVSKIRLTLVVLYFLISFIIVKKIIQKKRYDFN